MSKFKFVFSFFFLVVFMLLLVFPWDTFIENKISLSNMLASPSLSHPLGTDNLGRDLLLRTISAVKDTVLPIWYTVFFSFVVGVFSSLIIIFFSQHKKYIFFSKILHLSTGIIVSIPIGILVFAIAAIQEKIALESLLVSLFILLGARSMQKTWTLYLHDNELGYWLAHQSIGGNLLTRIIRYGIFGNWRGPLMEVLFFQLQASLVIEASLSYLGFGIAEPKASFGNMLASHFNLYLKGDWHVLLIVVFAFFAVSSVPAAAYNVITFALNTVTTQVFLKKNT